MQWGNVDAANNSPKWKGVLAGPKGYVAQYEHSGPVSKMTLPTGAAYSNNDRLIISVGTPGTTYANAVLSMVTNATGFVQSASKLATGSFSVGAANLQYAVTNATFGTAAGNTSTTGFTATVENAVHGAELYANVTQSAFVNGQAVGVFGVSVNELGTSLGIGPGWVETKLGSGGITGLNVSGGVNMVTGETIKISNGSANGIGTITANGLASNATSNATSGNATSVAVTSPGAGFTNAAMVVLGFNREQHLLTLQYSGTATGFSNTDTVRVSNGISNATATVSTNATGGTLTFKLTNLGLFANTLANNQVVITVLANTGANSIGTGATFTANLSPSTGGTTNVASLGGHAGRIYREQLVVVKGMANNTTSGGGGSTTP